MIVVISLCAYHSLEVRGRAMTTNPIQSTMPSSSSQLRNRSKSESNVNHQSAQQAHKESVESLVHRDGRVKLEYTQKFQVEVTELISRYLKPTRSILSSQTINLADKKLQKYLNILQVVQQRLVKVISEVKNDDSIVSLAIRANDCIVSTILWFNALVKTSKKAKNKNESVKTDKTMAASKNVMENIDLVGLEQQLLMDQAALFKKKQLRDLKRQKEAQQSNEVMVKKEDDKKSDDNALEVVSTVDENVEVVNDGDVEIVVEDKKEIKDMLADPVATPPTTNENNVQSMDAQEQLSEKIMNDFANIAIESASSNKVNIDVNGNVNGNEKNNEDVVDLLNMNVDEIANEDVTEDVNVSEEVQTVVNNAENAMNNEQEQSEVIQENPNRL